jgi:diaminopimelate epimerase
MMVPMDTRVLDLKGLPFAKGHGTGNDFVIVPDPDGELNLPPDLVAALCDRRRGVGGDGVLRVVRTAVHPEVADRADEAEWFMDYRNADGSLAEMCGNGVRVYARYLVASGLADGPRIPILTRAGLVLADIGGETIAVTMPTPVLVGPERVRVSGVDFDGTAATCGNPNLVCWVDDPDTLDLAGTPVLDPAAFPESANVEFIAAAGDRHVRMRVIERGVGETLSCGSGACAAAAVVLDGQGSGTVTVDVPGGRLTVTLDGDRCVLSGPAVIVAAGTLSL